MSDQVALQESKMFLASLSQRLWQQGPHLTLLADLLAACLRWPDAGELERELLCLLQELSPLGAPEPLLLALIPWLEKTLPPLLSDLQPYAPWLQACLKALPVWGEFVGACQANQLGPRSPELLGQALCELLLQRCYVVDAEFERLLTGLRRLLLAALAQADISWEPVMLLLARQAWNNSYVWAVSPSEAQSLASLSDGCQGLLPLIRAGYQPWAKVTPCRPAWQELINSCVGNPELEAELVAALPQLTSLPDDKTCYDFYQASPYPRWLAPERVVVEALDQQLSWLFPHHDWQSALFPGMEVLIAGCGTGQQLIQQALQQPQARLTGFDLSSSALGYAARMLAETGLQAELFQADLQGLTHWPRRFDLIACGGLLHHLPDPEAGLANLVRLLKPGALLKLGIYSARARQPVNQLRQRLGITGQESPAQVREIRQKILTDPSPAATWLRQTRDFYSLPMCRDLLCHPCEQSYGLSELAGWFGRQSLQVLGLELWNPQHYFVYQQSFPEDPAMTDLARWDQLEASMPSLFAGMFVIWLKYQPESDMDPEPAT